MVNFETVLKIRAYAALALLVVAYPALIAVAILTKVLSWLFGQRPAKSIAGEIAVVTGAGQGLGRAIALELAAKGCPVAVVDLNEEQAQSTAELIRERFNVKSKAYKVDVSDHAQVMELARRVDEDLGTATILVNNAGLLVFSDLFKPDWREVQRMVNVNLTALFWTQEAFLPGMKQLKRGHVVAISSIASFFPLIYSSVYTSTKFAVRGLMRVLQMELLDEGFGDTIHATTVYPNFLQTNRQVADLVEKYGVDRAYPLISGEEAAATIVAGMQRNEAEVVLPSFLALVFRLFETFPWTWQRKVLVTALSDALARHRKELSE